ncbi:Killer toxin, Kp4/SMK-like, core [Cordyceps fumosorosea ARSEF 2679]|uniref:Killer toxin, Kp4/SMK-like, core n=1 Tax=Cordyceps fumosorosea (strain ARSEF 2679) TaxID=1081104 RepID=A0A162I4D8_CORFA|nr:Killer toxin, Kp4/SMK-like, core [Cordyceps fumosorosea ARSEF 2679]OAA52155.1 Killer toxin, Kp4/SMK-like, core [Cordyceps fumosorosea ARSEF 2679]
MKFFSLSLFLTGAAALGINCRGSGFCNVNDASLQVVHDQVGNLIASGGGDRRFNGGDQIACSHGSQGSICAFYQNGASGSTKDAYGQLQQLLDHKCHACGSVPTEPGNDVSKGELTVNYVSKPCCEGDCHC